MSRRTFGTVWKPQRRDAYYVAFRLVKKGKRIIRKGGTLAQARRLLSLIEAEVHDRRPPEEILHKVFGDKFGPQITFRDLVAEYEQRPRNTPAGRRTARSERILMQRICREPWTAKPVGELRPPDLQKYLDSVCKRTSDPTANRYRSKISAAFRWGIPRGHVHSNPVTGTETYDESGREKETYLTGAECRALFDVASPLLRPILVFALSTGMRRGAILDLRWKNLNFDAGDHGEVELDPGTGSKRKAPRIPMTPALRSALLCHRGTKEAVAPEGRVFPYNEARVSDHFRKAVTLCAAIPDEKKPKVTFHTTRHTAASLMVQRGVSLVEVARILGHSTLEITKRYAHFAPDWAKKPIESLGAALDFGLLGDGPPSSPPNPQNPPVSGGDGWPGSWPGGPQTA